MKSKYLKYSLSLLFLLLGVTSAPIAMATDWAETNRNILEKFAIPSYQQLLSASEKMLTQADAFCKQTDQQQLKKTRSHFHTLMDAWQQVQVLRTGPAENFMRHFRIEMWPDRSNAGAKQILKLLSEADPEALEAKRFANASTAVQGLPAIERLLFSKQTTASQFKSADKPNYRCQLLKAISGNLHNMSKDTLSEWQGAYKKAIANPGGNNGYFVTHKEVSAQFLKEMATQLQAVVEQKFNRPLDEKRFRPKRAESWRSQRSLRNILLNVQSAAQLYQIGFAPLIKSEQLTTDFKLAIETGKKLDMSLQQAHEKETATLAHWRQQISKIKQSISLDLPKELDIPLGFNSLDGD